MGFAIDAVHYRADGTIAAVKWHPYQFDPTLRNGKMVVASIFEVMEVAGRGHEIRTCDKGNPGALVVLAAAGDSATIVDLPGAPRGLLLLELPKF